jgi:peptidoglycan/xylan/chitin deacetylase (PgdA/CDA1 family)
VNVLWSASGLLTVAASVLQNGGKGILAWRLDTSKKIVLSFVPLETPAGSGCALSPDGKRALFWGEEGLAVMDYVNWRGLQSPESPPVYACAWINNDEYISGNEWRIERVNLSGSRRLVCLSWADEFGFEEGSGRIFIKNGGGAASLWFSSDGKSPWVETLNPRVRRASQVSGRYRVYLENQSAGPYENIPMIRNTASVGTAALIAPGRERPPARLLPERPGREGQREIALCFDLYDDDTGLSQALDALGRFGIKATFFLNGDFIRRHPEAAKSIAQAGHETASLFYAPIDLADSRYRISPEYIARGLARNEDDYYEAVGGELGLLWHPPFYRTSAEIASAASRTGYATIGRDVDPMDWVGADAARRMGISQYSASDMIERIMESKGPGSIVPIRLGLLQGGRNDYLFLRLEVLLSALYREGYEVMPVSTIVRHAR